jgi:hypothetical protein
MSPKTTTKAPTKKSPRAAKPADATEKLRKAAIAEIEQRIAGTETASTPKGKRAKGAAKPEPVTKPAKTKRDADAKRPSGLDLAAKALEMAGQPLNAQQLATAAITLGWQTRGKTPHATLYAAVIREIAAKGRDSRFTKTDRGLFASNRKGA